MIIRNLKVDPALLHARFQHDCSMTRCAARCCATGVWTDSAEQRSILRHAAVIQARMDPSQERNPDRWFDPEPWDHPDFPSSRGIGTAVANGVCVFLGADRRCVLQKVSDARTGQLKPFFCRTFPLTIVDGTLCLDDAADAACCTPTPNGPLTVLELCADELVQLLGPEGVRELQDQARSVTE